MSTEILKIADPAEKRQNSSAMPPPPPPPAPPSDDLDPTLTFSTKISSTDQLICKTPQSSTNSLKSVEKPSILAKNKRECIIIGERKDDTNALLYYGVLHFVFGFLMVVFGCMVIHYEANLAQLGGGIWAGCLAMSCGITGILASAKEWFPLKSTPQRITHTIFLVLSLITLATAQLIMALAAIGALRDWNNSEYVEDSSLVTTTTTELPGQISITLPLNYMSILSNLGLLAVSLAEFTIAAITSYKSSRQLCPCFQKSHDAYEKSGEVDVEKNRNAMVSSWLGKMNSSNRPMYIVAPGGTTSTLSKHSQLSTLTPVFAIPAHHPTMIRYPLIPAPLGMIPSPQIPPNRKRMIRVHRGYKKRYAHHAATPKAVQNVAVHQQKKMKSKQSKKQVTDADVVKTYTGLDKAIAEEFIDICDSRNASSFCSDSCCNNGANERQCQCQSSDAVSTEYLVNKL